MVLVHRAIGNDLRRLTASIDELASVGGPPARLGAIRRYTAALLAEIRGHHETEDDIFWPVVAAAALQAVDLGPLTDDHQAIAATLRRASQALSSPGEPRPAGRDATRATVTSAEVHLPAARGRLPGRRPQPASRQHTWERCLPEGTTGRDGKAVTQDSSCQVLTPIPATMQMGQFGTPPTAQRQVPVAAA